ASSTHLVTMGLASPPAEPSKPSSNPNAMVLRWGRVYDQMMSHLRVVVSMLFGLLGVLVNHARPIIGHMCLIKQVLCLIYGSRCIIARNMSMSENPTTPTQSRTRQAILEAAVQVLIRDRSAPLSDVAKRADVARSTLHR